MTREEYRKLLNSDYWRGYSYSLIKERNFTCEDCGRRFYGQRNKLQVHHLKYRDANPWSYSPEELIVLCEDCHRKRHGLYYSNVENNKIATIAKWYNKLFYLLFSKTGILCLVLFMAFCVVLYNNVKKQPITQEEKTEQITEKIQKKNLTERKRRNTIKEKYKHLNRKKRKLLKKK